jgi:hypothetical protein
MWLLWLWFVDVVVDDDCGWDVDVVDVLMMLLVWLLLLMLMLMMIVIGILMF